LLLNPLGRVAGLEKEGSEDDEKREIEFHTVQK
jgi:hypothetical protein